MEIDKSMARLQRTNSAETKQQNLLASSFQRAILKKYGDLKNFMLIFTCEHEKTYCNKVWRCIFGSAPTLSQINATYGEGTAAAWLVPFIFDVSEFSGCSRKLSKNQIAELANIIVENYHWLKVTEMMLYFWWLKSGRYGRFYGNIDPMMFTTTLPQFIEDRNNIIAKRDMIEEEKKQQEWKKNAMTYQEWRAKHEKDGI